MKYKIALIKGDGIGPEAVAEAVKVLDTEAEKFGLHYVAPKPGGLQHIGLIHTDHFFLTLHGNIKSLHRNPALLGAVGGDVGNSRWYDVAPNLRPEAGLLAIRKGLNLFLLPFFDTNRIISYHNISFIHRFQESFANSMKLIWNFIHKLPLNFHFYPNA